MCIEVIRIYSFIIPELHSFIESHICMYVYAIINRTANTKCTNNNNKKKEKKYTFKRNKIKNQQTKSIRNPLP